MEEVKKWRVVGVDKDTGHETSMVFSASTAGVAKVMGERRGILVAEVVDIERAEIQEIAKEMRRPIPKPEEEDKPPLVLPRGAIICPNANCGYVGMPRKEARGSFVLGLLLLLFFILPGLLYVLFTQGYRYSCPRCGLQIRKDN